MITISNIIQLKGEGRINQNNYKDALKLLLKDIISDRKRKEYKDIEKQRKIQEKIDLENKLNADLEKYGKFFYEVWSRDCDMCESTRIIEFESIEDYYETVDKTGEWAEGPVTYTYVHPLDATDFESSFRDRAFESYENGNGNSIYV
jgi:hypothetical protein